MDNKIELMGVIGLRIQGLLNSRRKLQKDLAEYLDIQENTISYFCRGKRAPNVTQLIEIAKYFNTSVDYLLGLSKNDSKDPDTENAHEATGLSTETIERLFKIKSNVDNEEHLLKTIDIIIQDAELLRLINSYLSDNEKIYAVFDNKGPLELNDQLLTVEDIRKTFLIGVIEELSKPSGATNTERLSYKPHHKGQGYTMILYHLSFMVSSTHERNVIIWQTSPNAEILILFVSAAAMT